MLSKTFTTAALLSALSLVQAQTFTDCDPTKKSCPADPALGTSITTDFTKGASSDWTALAGTTMTYDKTNGAQFVIATNTNAPTIELNKYIFFGSVSVVMKASPGSGVVSSFILESDDLDEIDWEWLGGAPNDVQSNFFGKGDTTTYDRGATYTGVGPVIDSFMKYTIEWTDESIKWSVGPENGPMVLKRQLFYTDPLSKSGTRYPQTPMKVKMGSWIACLDKNDPAKKGTCDWAGGEYSQAGAPYTMSVKSVEVQDYGCGAGGSYTYSDMTGSWQSIKPAGYCAGPKANSVASSQAPVSSSSTSSSSTQGGVFAESSTTTHSSASTSSSASASSTSAASTTSSGSSSSSSAAPTTLAQSTSSGSSPTKTSSAASVTTSAPAQQSANAAGVLKPKHQMGALDYSVIVLGLALGYLVM